MYSNRDETKVDADDRRKEFARKEVRAAEPTKGTIGKQVSTEEYRQRACTYHLLAMPCPCHAAGPASSLLCNAARSCWVVLGIGTGGRWPFRRRVAWRQMGNLRIPERAGVGETR